MALSARAGAASAFTATANASLSIAHPTTPADGELLVIWCYSRGAAVSFAGGTAPATWTRLDGGSGTYGSWAIFARIWNTGDSTAAVTVTTNLATGDCSAGRMLAFAGAATTGTVSEAIDVAPAAQTFAASGSTPQTVTHTGITTQTANAGVILFGGKQDGANATTHWSGWATGYDNELFDNNSATGGDMGYGAAWGAKASAGATGNLTATMATAPLGDPDFGTTMVAMAVKPSVAAPTTVVEGAGASDALVFRQALGTATSASASTSDASYGGYANHGQTLRPVINSVSDTTPTIGDSFTINGYEVISELVASVAAPDQAIDRNDPTGPQVYEGDLGEAPTSADALLGERTARAFDATFDQSGATASDEVYGARLGATYNHAVTPAESATPSDSIAGERVARTFTATLDQSGSPASDAINATARWGVDLSQNAEAGDGTACNYKEVVVYNEGQDDFATPDMAAAGAQRIPVTRGEGPTASDTVRATESISALASTGHSASTSDAVAAKAVRSADISAFTGASDTVDARGKWNVRVTESAAPSDEEARNNAAGSQTQAPTITSLALVGATLTVNGTAGIPLEEGPAAAVSLACTQVYAATYAEAVQAAENYANTTTHQTAAPTISVVTPNPVVVGSTFEVSGMGVPTGTVTEQTFPRDVVGSRQAFALTLSEAISAADSLTAPTGPIPIPSTLESIEASSMTGEASGNDALLGVDEWIEWTVLAAGSGGTYTIEAIATSFEGAKLQLAVDNNPEQTFLIYSDEEEEERP